MNTSSPLGSAPTAARHLASTDARVIEQIRDGGLSLVLWKRRLPRGLRDALRQWAAQSPARLERVTSDDAWVEAALPGFPQGPARTYLAADLRALLHRFRTVSGKRTVKVSFGTVTGDQCRKFHADYQGLRLITTYLGPGTEWLPEHAVRRDALVEPPECPATANGLIVRDPRLVQHAQAGDVLILRGHDGVTGAALGAVHRSPPIAASQETRVVLVASA
jgi:hypothetical protein